MIHQTGDQRLAPREGETWKQSCFDAEMRAIELHALHMHRQELTVVSRGFDAEGGSPPL